MSDLHQPGDCDCKCCPGPMGQPGPQGIPGLGIQGPQGLQGLPGRDGKDGHDGKDGIDGQNGQQGPMGPQGESGQKGDQGIQGQKGDCIECPCQCLQPEFAEVFSQLPQQLLPSPGPSLPGGVVLFENLIVSTPNIDSSQAASLGEFIVKLAGWYDVASGITGFLNPIPSPLPVFTVSMFLNGNIVNGSSFSNLPLSPAQASNEVTADVFVYCNAGDKISFANTSTAPLFLSAPSTGTNAQTNSAYAKILLLRVGPK